MSSLNPYEKYLDGRPPEAILSHHSTMSWSGCSPSSATRRSTSRRPPASGAPRRSWLTWPIARLVFAFRLRQTLAEDGPLIQPFDQDKWAATYTGVSGRAGACRLQSHPRLEPAPDRARAP
jgi:hypothetical protein